MTTDPIESLRLATGEARRRVAAEADGLEQLRSGAPQPGDVFTLSATDELPVEWVGLEQDPDEDRRLLAVPADANPLIGSADVAVSAEEPCGPLSLRCTFAVWLNRADLDPKRLTGGLGTEIVERARRKRAELEAETLAGSPEEREVDGEVEYRLWIQEVLEPARTAASDRPAAVAKEKGETEDHHLGRRRRGTALRELSVEDCSKREGRGGVRQPRRTTRADRRIAQPRQQAHIAAAQEEVGQRAKGAPMPGSDSEVTELLQGWSGGDLAALDQLTPLVFKELHRLARAHFAREPQSHTLQPTALVSEVFVRLLGRRKVQWQNRAQFFGAATQLMRRILVDHARRRRAVKRGGDVVKVPLDEVAVLTPMPDIDMMALDEALDKLERHDPQCRQIVELKFFLGLTHDEIAEVIGKSSDTVKLKWAASRARLHRHLEGD